MAKFQKRLEARELRKKGFSTGFIAEKLGVSKGSVSSWCSGVILNKKQKRILLDNSIKAGHKGRMIGAEMNRKKKTDKISFYKNKGLLDIGKISDRDLLLAGVALYWGEGTKSDKSSLAFVNSDPEAILFMFIFFNKIMGVDKDDFMPRIFINEMHKKRINKVLKFWSNLLKLPIEQFGNPVFLKMRQEKVYENYDDYFGVLSLKVRKSSDLKYRLLGLIEALKKNNMSM